jgi:uncharacterized protein YukE
MEIKVSGKELDIIICSLRQSIATMRSLWSGKGADMQAASNVPEELSEMEELLVRLRDERVVAKSR